MKVEIKTTKTYDVKYIAFNIPIYYSTTITEVFGKDRVEGIRYAHVE